MKSCIDSLIFLKAHSEGYAFLDTVPVPQKILKILRTVEMSTFKLVTIALCAHPRACLCQMVRHRISSLYALVLCDSQDAIVTVESQLRATRCVLNLNIAHTHLNFPTRKRARTWKCTVHTHSTPVHCTCDQLVERS